MQGISIALILVAAVINLAPVTGVLSADRLQALYGISVEGPNLAILMRHRALLFGIIGILLVVSAFHPPLRPVGYAAGLFGMLSFVAVAWGLGNYNTELRRVIVADLFGSAALVGAAGLDYFARARDAGPLAKLPSESIPTSGARE